jgi:hypothetical protein
MEYAIRRAKSMKMKAAGLSNDEIAEALTKDGLPTDEKQVQTARLHSGRKKMEQENEASDTARAQRIYELEQLKKMLWGRAMSGDLKAASEARRVVSELARITGAYAAQEQTVEHKHQLAIPVDSKEVERMNRAWALALPDNTPEAEVINSTAEEVEEDEEKNVDQEELF